MAERLAVGKFVLQYKLYCDIGARQGMAVSQYSHCAHDKAKLSVQAHGVLGAATRPGARAEGRCDTARGAQADAQGHAVGVRGAHGKGAQPGRDLGAAWACCWASRLCTWCTQPVFDPV